jgi:hypothetical protein
LTTIYTDSLTGSDSGNAGQSLRDVLTITGGAQGQVRVTFTGKAGSTTKIDHASIGIATGTGSNTTATPVELTFGGVSGFTFPNGSTNIASDWVNLSGFTSANKLVVIIDFDATTGGGDYAIDAASGTATAFFFGAATYNVASPAGGSQTNNYSVVALVEVQAGAAAPTWEFDSNETLFAFQRWRRLAAAMRGDDGNELSLINFVSVGEEALQPQQPPHPKPEKAGAIMRGVDGTESPLIQFFPMGWPVQDPQPPHPTPEKRAAGIMPKEDGIEFPFINWQFFGWPVQPPQPPAAWLKPNRFGSAEPAVLFMDAPFINFFPLGWELIQSQPEHPRPERSGADPWGDAGIEAPFVPPTTVTFALDVQPQLAARRPAIAGIRIKNEFGIFPNLVPMGWEVQSVQPPAFRYARSGAVAVGDQGDEATLINFFPFGYDPLQPQPNHPRPERASAIMPIEPGIEAVYSFVAPFSSFGWDVQPYQPQHLRPERFGAVAPASFVPDATLINFFQFGWPIAPHQPQHPRPERWASLIPADPGNEAPVIFQPYGWDAVIHQPQHPRPERAGAVMPIEQGVEAVYVFFVAPPIWPYELAPYQPQHLRIERAGALARWEDGTESPLIRFFPVGWEVQPPQPPHPRPERFAGLIGGDPGNESVLTFPLPLGWPFDPFQPLHRRYERWAALARGDDGTESTLIRWLNAGWQIQDIQPGHPRVERFGALVFGDAGNEAMFTAPLPAPLLWGHPFQETELIRSTWRYGAILAEYGYFLFVPAPIPPIPPIPPPAPRPPYRPPYKFGIYQVDTLLQLNANFYDTARQQLADPLEVTLFVMDPLGNVTQLPSPLFPDSKIVRTGIGTYYCDFLPSMPGEWKYKWQGTTSGVIGTTIDKRFFVIGSELLN